MNSESKTETETFPVTPKRLAEMLGRRHHNLKRSMGWYARSRAAFVEAYPEFADVEINRDTQAFNRLMVSALLQWMVWSVRPASKAAKTRERLNSLPWVGAIVPPTGAAAQVCKVSTPLPAATSVTIDVAAQMLGCTPRHLRRVCNNMKGVYPNWPDDCAILNAEQLTWLSLNVPCGRDLRVKLFTSLLKDRTPPAPTGLFLDLSDPLHSAKLIVELLEHSDRACRLVDKGVRKVNRLTSDLEVEQTLRRAADNHVSQLRVALHDRLQKGELILDGGGSALRDKFEIYTSRALRDVGLVTLDDLVRSLHVMLEVAANYFRMVVKAPEQFNASPQAVSLLQDKRNCNRAFLKFIFFTKYRRSDNMPVPRSQFSDERLVLVRRVRVSDDSIRAQEIKHGIGNAQEWRWLAWFRPEDAAVYVRSAFKVWLDDWADSGFVRHAVPRSAEPETDT